MRSSVKATLIILVLQLLSCDPNGVFDRYERIPTSWHKDSIVEFKFDPPDSIDPYNLFVNLRNDNDYKFSNIYLIVELEHPQGMTIKDTLLYKMAKPNGEFLGTGLSSIKENKLWFKEGYVFKESGSYKINIQHAMRENGKVHGIKELEGITDVGFRVERPDQ